jgi:hypothetical protein
MTAYASRQIALRNSIRDHIGNTRVVASVDGRLELARF